MGKPTGFMEFERLNKKEIEPYIRIKNFNDFHIPFDIKTQREQASRCMNCGVPFCQSAMKVNGRRVGCPLSNLIPEWNDLIYRGLFEEAYKRLELTAPFPEFTGNVCPALCEACCSCSINGDAVGVRANELFLIEEAYKNDWIKPKKNIVRNGIKVAIVGSGPAGLAAAKKLNESGYLVTVYEKSDEFGGLLMYGIPNMKLEKHIVSRRINLLKEEGINFVANTKIGYDISVEQLKKDYDEIIFACGTSQARMLNIKGSESEDILYAVDFLTETTKSLMQSKPYKYDFSGKKVVVVGGGDTANDCCGTLVRMGAMPILDLEINKEPPLNNTLPWPNYPNKKKNDYGIVESNCLMGYDIRRYQSTIDELVFENDKLKGVYITKVEYDGKNMKNVPNTREYFNCDKIILAMGFLGTKEEDLNAYNMSGDKYRVKLDGFKYDDKISVCGDMKNGQSLVVVALKDGIDCATRIIDKYNK